MLKGWYRMYSVYLYGLEKPNKINKTRVNKVHSTSRLYRLSNSLNDTKWIRGAVFILARSF